MEQPRHRYSTISLANPDATKFGLEGCKLLACLCSANNLPIKRPSAWCPWILWQGRDHDRPSAAVQPQAPPEHRGSQEEHLGLHGHERGAVRGSHHRCAFCQRLPGCLGYGAARVGQHYTGGRGGPQEALAD
eukprot:8488288-Alexandrium_andersonii.AAC.1